MDESWSDVTRIPRLRGLRIPSKKTKRFDEPEYRNFIILSTSRQHLLVENVISSRTEKNVDEFVTEALNAWLNRHFASLVREFNLTETRPIRRRPPTRKFGHRIKLISSEPKAISLEYPTPVQLQGELGHNGGYWGAWDSCGVVTAECIVTVTARNGWDDSELRRLMCSPNGFIMRNKQFVVLVAANPQNEL